MPVSRTTLMRVAAKLPLILMAAAATASYAEPDASAIPWPTKPVRIIVPVAPGGSADKLTRTLADRLGTLWGQSVVVENVPGASGTIGAAKAAKAAKAAPDGHTLLQQGEGMTLNGLLFAKLPYDSQKSFAPIIKAVVNPQVLVVNPSTGLHTLDQYIAQARAKPQSISLALPGNGGIAHVAHEILSQRTGARVNYIPYSGGGPATLDVLGGHADATLITLAAVTEYVRAGKLRALAVTTPYRSEALPDVPTVAEAGVPGFAVESWQGYFAPAGTPRQVIEKINSDMRAVLQAPDVRAQLEKLGFKVAGGTSRDLAQSLRAERPFYAKTINAAGLMPQ